MSLTLLSVFRLVLMCTPPCSEGVRRQHHPTAFDACVAAGTWVTPSDSVIVRAREYLLVRDGFSANTHRHDATHAPQFCNFFVLAFTFATFKTYFSCVPYLIVAIVYMGFREVTNQLADPFGIRETDFPVMDFLDYAFDHCTSLLEAFSHPLAYERILRQIRSTAPFSDQQLLLPTLQRKFGADKKDNAARMKEVYAWGKPAPLRTLRPWQAQDPKRMFSTALVDENDAEAIIGGMHERNKQLQDYSDKIAEDLRRIQSNRAVALAAKTEAGEEAKRHKESRESFKQEVEHWEHQYQELFQLMREEAGRATTARLDQDNAAETQALIAKQDAEHKANEALEKRTRAEEQVKHASERLRMAEDQIALQKKKEEQMTLSLAKKRQEQTEVQIQVKADEISVESALKIQEVLDMRKMTHAERELDMKKKAQAREDKLAERETSSMEKEHIKMAVEGCKKARSWAEKEQRRVNYYQEMVNEKKAKLLELTKKLGLPNPDGPEEARDEFAPPPLNTSRKPVMPKSTTTETRTGFYSRPAIGQTDDTVPPGHEGAIVAASVAAADAKDRSLAGKGQGFETFEEARDRIRSLMASLHGSQPIEDD
eukprot:TRINITY_DN1913_c1_g1_i4.p1 TRINITY_DN1913_c1_g1~~TRINITY_DN1913_c1_g1_i4.p1  ORF type:complete len:598 (-),score=174.39 TRINITY_DN1913_c1_g1_i4:238-2031(-)